MQKKIILLSIPRSGSSWLSRRISKLYGLTFFSEPFRVIFGSKYLSPVNPANRLNPEAVNDPTFWGSFEMIDGGIFSYLTDFISKSQNIIIKETNLILQIDFYKKLLPDMHIVILLRHPISIYYSHLKIENVYETWGYDLRIEKFRSFLKEENMTDIEKYYLRADKEEFRGSRKLALLFAHILAQYDYLVSRPEPKLFYEELIEQDIIARLKVIEPFKKWEVLDYSIVDIDKGPKQNYKTHGTKNPVNPYSWIENISEEDKEVLFRIAGRNLVTDIVFEQIKVLSKENSVVPEICFQDMDISNRVITISEYCIFLNALIDCGINSPHLLLCVNSSLHTLICSGKRFLARKPNMPMVFISPVGALAFALFYGYSLPTPNQYQKIVSQRKYYLEQCNLSEINFGEKIGTTNIPGKFPMANGYYDMYGNVKEICLNEFSQKVAIIGGSFKDELSDLAMNNLSDFPIIFRDMDVGFRVCKMEKIIDRNHVITILKNNTNPVSLFIELINYFKMS